MKRIVVLFTTLLSLYQVQANNDPDWNGKYTKEKKITREFKVDPNALLEIHNSYGNLYITSWNENRTVIEVTIKTNSNNESKAQKKLDEIDVRFENSPSAVMARTIIQKEGWNWSWGNNNVHMEINYTVKIPVGNEVNLNNDYGAIFLDKINGKAIISCDYGRLELGSLNADNNELNFDYSSNSEISYMKSGSISADYSGFEILRAERIDLRADYTKSSFREIQHLTYSCDYGSVNIEQLTGKLDGNGDYLGVKIGQVSGSVGIRSDYGSIKIDRLTPQAGSVSIESDYTNIKIGYASGYDFDFEAQLDYASLKGLDAAYFKVQREQSHSKYYSGTVGNSGKNKITINSDYGDVQFINN